MTSALIIVPPDDDRLQAVALRVKSDVESQMHAKKIHVLNLDQLDSSDYFAANDLILIGNPCVKGDIYWPMQIRVDGLIHRIVKGDFSKKVVSGFTISTDHDESVRSLKAILWTFTETKARIVEGLDILVSDTTDEQEQKIQMFIQQLKHATRSVALSSKN